MFMHNFCSCYIDKSNFVYVLVHRNILMYNIYLHTIKQTSDNTIVSNEYNRPFLLNAHHLHYMSSRVAWIW